MPRTIWAAAARDGRHVAVTGNVHSRGTTDTDPARAGCGYNSPSEGGHEIQDEHVGLLSSLVVSSSSGGKRPIVMLPLHKDGKPS